ncbi:MAG TPA: DegT/DnrJ/EryC1/StrS family aminotransferase [Iamia sp.]
MIPYGRQTIDDDDVAAVVAVLRGSHLTTGPAVDAFEAGLTAVTGARHAVAFANGTAALHAAAAAGGLGPGDRVGVPALTFAASANAARYVGATPVLLDVDPATLNLDPAAAPAGLDALVAVHYAGLPVDLAALAHRPRLVVEDAAHALGAATPDGPVGSCAHSDMCCFSFHPVKPITTAEGGAVTTNDDELAARLRRFRSHGLVRRPEEGGWYQVTVEEGFNYRLTDLQAALGTSQLAKLDRFRTARHAQAERYREALADLPLDLPPAPPLGWRHGHHLFAVRVDDRRRAYDRLHAAGVGVQVHYVPLHHHPWFAAAERHGDLAAVDAAYERLLSLPLHPSLSETDQETVIDTLRSLW